MPLTEGIKSGKLLFQYVYALLYTLTKLIFYKEKKYFVRLFYIILEYLFVHITQRYADEILSLYILPIFFIA